MAKVVTFTLNPAVDKSINVDQLVPERKLRADEPLLEPGGGGINVSRVLNELGIPNEAHWTRGGPTGARMQTLLDALKIDHHPLMIEGETREHLIVFESHSGQQYRFGMPGPTLVHSELAAIKRRIAALPPTTPYLVLSGSLPEGVPTDTYAQLAQAAPTTTRVILDTSGQALDMALANATGRPFYLIKPNIRELGQLAHHDIQSDSDIAATARTLIKRGVVEVVVTSLGAGGATATTASEHWAVRAPTVPFRSSVGAGDSMVAGMVAALYRGQSLRDAVRFGVAAGAAAVMVEGSQLCHREDVARLDAEMRATESGL